MIKELCWTYFWKKTLVSTVTPRPKYPLTPDTIGDTTDSRRRKFHPFLFERRNYIVTQWSMTRYPGSRNFSKYRERYWVSGKKQKKTLLCTFLRPNPGRDTVSLNGTGRSRFRVRMVMFEEGVGCHERGPRGGKDGRETDGDLDRGLYGYLRLLGWLRL